MKKSRVPEEEAEGEDGGGKKDDEDEDSEEAVKKAREFDDFKDGRFYYIQSCM